jgi:hypothetical protein
MTGCLGTERPSLWAEASYHKADEHCDECSYSNFDPMADKSCNGTWVHHTVIISN